ncbi:hypothetical protein [Desulfovibrio aminophilus]|uniref:hypothetical protein n=1 Tax=Desulfovibrio aminophilus TaxID=81425 RepID=UPI00041E4EF6|nr:hypothetical protein [Desulfovibrio aminophilus]
MAEKKVILLLAGEVSLDGGDAAKKFKKKAVLVNNYTAGDVAAEALRVAGAAAVAPEGIAQTLEAGAALCVVKLGAPDAAALDAALAKALEAADRRTLVVLAGSNLLAFQGLGVNTKTGSTDRQAFARDVVPTLAHIADLPIPDDTTGAVLYQVLKETNLKLNEFIKLKEALARMETALQRDNREPWDKHDCA